MATSTKAAALAQTLTKIGRQWAPDTLRSQLQFGRFLESLAQHPNLTPQAVDAAKALQDNVMMKKVHLLHLPQIEYSSHSALSRQLSINFPTRC